MRDSDDTPDVPFTPELMERLADKVDTLHADTLLGVDGAAAAFDAEQFYLLALASLKQAQSYFTLAQYAQSRALV